MTELCLCHREAIVDERNLEDITDIINTCNLTIPLVSIAPDGDAMGEDALTRFMNAISRDRDDGTGRVEMLCLLLREAEEWQVELIMASIPITGIQTLQVLCRSRYDRDDDEDGTMGQHAWTWLAYAAYHPWTSESNLSLDLDALDISEPAARPMQGALAAQRHLYRLVHGRGDPTLPAEDNRDWPEGRYAVVSLRENVTCFEDESMDGETMCTFKPKIRLTAVIQFDTITVATLPDAVCVIVPGGGVAWIAKEDVEALSRPAAEYAEIDGLKLGSPHANRAMELTTLQPLFRLCRTLDIESWGSMTAAKLLDVLCECLVVESLRVRHRGDLFHDWTEDTPGDDDTLYELALTSLQMRYIGDAGPFRPPSQAAWKGILRNLSVFSLRTDSFDDDHGPAIRQTFQEGLHVKHFVWKNTIWGTPIRSYETKYLNTRKLLGISEGRYDKAQHPLNAAARRAFASVIKRKAQENDARDARGLRSRKGSVLGRLDTDVARLICDFATTDTTRVVWAEEGKSTPTLPSCIFTFACSAQPMSKGALSIYTVLPTMSAYRP